MKKQIVITMDLEPDLTKYIDESYLGMESISKFIDLLGKYEVTCDFFITADVCVKFTDIVKEISKQGHYIGSHGSDHRTDYYCNKKYHWQMNEIKKSHDIIEKIIGNKITMFRTPNFSANSDTIKILDKSGFKIDSSILPGRIVKKWRLKQIYDFSCAPRIPYHPDKEDITKKGNSTILEIPLTENPEIPGSPIGIGYLNNFGIELAKKLIDTVQSTYITFLLHPWEIIDLGRYYPNIPQCWTHGCKANLQGLDDFIKYIKEQYSFTCLNNIYSDYE